MNSDVDKTLRAVDFMSDLCTTRHTAARFRIAHQDPRAVPRAYLHCSASSFPHAGCRDEQKHGTETQFFQSASLENLGIAPRVPLTNAIPAPCPHNRLRLGAIGDSVDFISPSRRP